MIFSNLTFMGGGGGGGERHRVPDGTAPCSAGRETPQTNKPALQTVIFTRRVAE